MVMKKTNRSHALAYLKSLWTYYYLLIIALFAVSGIRHPPPTTGEVTQQLLYTNLLWVHFVLGAIALLIGPLQLSKNFRQANIKRHRILGMTYVSCIYISGIAGFWMAFNSQLPWFGYSLAVLDVVWIITTTLALFYAKQRRIAEHQLWITRSFIVTNVFVVFRFMIPIAFAIPYSTIEYKFALFVQVALWSMLGIYELRRRKAPTSPALAAV